MLTIASVAKSEMIDANGLAFFKLGSYGKSLKLSIFVSSGRFFQKRGTPTRRTSTSPAISTLLGWRLEQCVKASVWILLHWILKKNTTDYATC